MEVCIWGRNDLGQLGDGTTIDRNRPVKIMDHVVELSLGNCCSGAITEDGSLYMWGIKIKWRSNRLGCQ